MKTYAQKLKDPRWQKKRLFVLERDAFTCQQCRSKEDSLTVHHMAYAGEPWEIDDEMLITLCETCHKEVESAIKRFRQAAPRSWELIQVIDLLSEFAQSNRISDAFDLLFIYSTTPSVYIAARAIAKAQEEIYSLVSKNFLHADGSRNVIQNGDRRSENSTV